MRQSVEDGVPNAFGGTDGTGAGVFGEKAVRLGFIRKVYGILMTQLSVTCGIIGIFFIDAVRDFTAANSYLFWIAFAATLVCIITLACCGETRRKAPLNMILLGIFTLCQGFLLGVVTSTYRVDEVLLAVGVTALLVLALTIFAMQTKIDFTGCSAVLLIALVCLMLFGFFVMILPNSRILNIVYACLGAFLFGVYLIFDTQMMLGGTHKYSISPEEYVFASLNLYLDIVNLFLFILNIIGSSNR